jgi:hypothetical protein
MKSAASSIVWNVLPGRNRPRLPIVTPLLAPQTGGQLMREAANPGCRVSVEFKMARPSLAFGV